MGGQMKNRKGIITDQQGTALVVALLMLVVMTAMGITATNTSIVETWLSANYRSSNQAFYIAEAGAERARELLRTKIADGSNLSAELNALRGLDNVLVNSNSVSNFPSDDTPFSSTSFGAGRFEVYLTNDSIDGVTSTNDTNRRVTITSFGYGPNNSMAVVQTIVEQGGGMPNLPGAIVLPGPNVTFHGGNSNAQLITGVTQPAVAVNTEAARTSVVAGIPENRRHTYQGNNCPAPCVQSINIPYPWNDLQGLKDVLASLSSVADFTSTTAPGFNWGTAANPRIVFIDGNVSIEGGVEGHGILVVTGTLELKGNFNYDGIILAIGRGEVIRKGAGGGTISGGILAANIMGNALGNPTWHTSGGGKSRIEFDAASQNRSVGSLPFLKRSWRQL